MSVYVLDTSALLAFIEDEDGAAEVQELFNRAVTGDAELLVSVVSCIELFYVSWQEQGERVAHERLRLLSDLPVSQQPLSAELAPLIGEIKATTPIAFADCCIAGLAKTRGAVLVHKDPEYERLSQAVQQHRLPYHQPSNRS